MSYLFLLSRLGTIRIHTKMATTPKLKNTNYMTRRRDSCLVVYSSKSYSQLNSFVCDCDLSILILMFSKRFVSSGQWHSWSRHRTQYQEGSVIYTLIEYAMSNATCFFCARTMLTQPLNKTQINILRKSRRDCLLILVFLTICFGCHCQDKFTATQYINH